MGGKERGESEREQRFSETQLEKVYEPITTYTETQCNIITVKYLHFRGLWNLSILTPTTGWQCKFMYTMEPSNQDTLVTGKNVLIRKRGVLISDVKMSPV